MKVLISDSISDRGIEILKTAGIEVDVKTKLSKDELKSVLGQYDGLIVRSATKVTADVLENPGRLKVIGRAGSGLDNVDGEAATKKGIVVMNTPGGEHGDDGRAFHRDALRRRPEHPPGPRLAQGGPVGEEEVHGRGADGQDARGCRPREHRPGRCEPGARAQDARRGVRSVHLRGAGRAVGRGARGPAGALRAERFHLGPHAAHEGHEAHDRRASVRPDEEGRPDHQLRPRGIVNEADLLDAMKSGKVAAAAFDVFEKEPPEGNPLLALESFIATPHLGASTEEAQENVATAVAEQIVDYLVHGIPRNAVNVPRSRPSFCRRSGRIFSSRRGWARFSGRPSRGDPRGRYRVSGRRGGVRRRADHGRGAQGAPQPDPRGRGQRGERSLDRARAGIEVRESRVSEIEDYTSLIALTVKTSKTAGHVSGTLFGRKDPRIVSIESMRVEVVPDGSMLILTNNDKPGVIGSIGTFMGENSINIARMQLGREKAGGRAVAVVSIDSPVANDLLDRLAKLPNILSVKQVRL